jgi:site-specific DNA-methyltransferase (adenine-specific)
MGCNPKDVWSVSRLHSQDPERANHPTQKPLEIIERIVLASCPPGGHVLDPFMGSGTTPVAALMHGRRVTGFELNPDYFAEARRRVDALQSPAPTPLQPRRAAARTRARAAAALPLQQE